jgi:hypothetical protein
LWYPLVCILTLKAVKVDCTDALAIWSNFLFIYLIYRGWRFKTIFWRFNAHLIRNCFFLTNLKCTTIYIDEIHSLSVLFLLQYLALGVVELPTPCIDLRYISICINFSDSKEISAALCLLRSIPNLRELEMVVSTHISLICGCTHCFCYLYEIVREEICKMKGVVFIQTGKWKL